MDMDTAVRYVAGVGEAREKLLVKLGIKTIRDLIAFFPREHEDRTGFKKTIELGFDEAACVRAIAVDVPKLSHIRKGLDLVKFRAADDDGVMDIAFFNQGYIKDAIKQGESYVFYGKNTGTLLKPAMQNPLFEREDRSGELTDRIVPVYPLTAGLSQKIMVGIVRRALDACGDDLPDVLPVSISAQYELCKVRFAYENIHFPADTHCLEIARKRLVFEELFVLAAAMRLLRERRGVKSGHGIDTPELKEFFDTLPFKPTNAQRRAIDETATDMALTRPMNRLIQGDVGSGKTLIAAACCWIVWKSGFQSAFMAPTEILAKQHLNTLTSLLQPLGMRIELLTGSMTTKQKRDIYERLSSGDIDLIVGTHALITEGVRFSNLALTITDEQHRFGVNQRSLLTEKGDSPHVLVMSATPIPRTLALIIYGDLDISIIDEMPPGRQKIETYIVGESYRQRIYAFAEKLVGEGRQVFIVCPMVDESEALDEGLKSAREYCETLKKDVFQKLNVTLVHGKMKSKEKDAAMAAFTAGEADILVATTVVEVGVDVPNAVVMIIENADRFGLSQLHQLRGRVGRGEHLSYCILFNDSDGDISNKRLDIMKETNDGFKIAEEDLKLRGPGDFFGSRQHGLPEMRIANFATDMKLLKEAQNAAERLLTADPKLTSPENRKLAGQIERLFEINADRLN